jgi:futalosine hydrolase
VGKANACGAVVRAASAHPYQSIINLGIAGALPNTHRTCSIGEVILATSSCFADEGVHTPSGFTPLAKLGFASCPNGSDSLEPHPELAERLATLAEICGIIATVSTCSGTDELATQVASRTNAIAEAMEGAAVLLAAAHLAIPA